MSYLIPKSFFSLPTLPSLLDDEDWGMMTNTPSGLTVAEDDQKVYVEVSVPGVSEDDLDITFEKGTLRVVAETKREEKDGKRYFRESQRRFSYQVAVPSEVDMNSDPEIELRNGVLHVTFAKSAKAQPRKLTVKKSGK